MSLAVVSSKPEPWCRWASEINKAWQSGVASILHTGYLLIGAKEDLEHGSFESMVQQKLPFVPQTARKLMAIARHPIISNRAHVRDLPASWATLYKLTKLPIGNLRTKFADGSINPKLERKEVAGWRKSERGKIEVGGRAIERKPSPYAQMRATNVELQEQLNKSLAENREMRATNDGGNYFTADSSAEQIANSVANLIRTSPAKMRAVASLLNKLAKEYEARTKTARPARRKRSA